MQTRSKLNKQEVPSIQTGKGKRKQLLKSKSKLNKVIESEKTKEKSKVVQSKRKLLDLKSQHRSIRSKQIQKNQKQHDPMKLRNKKKNKKISQQSQDQNQSNSESELEKIHSFRNKKFNSKVNQQFDKKLKNQTSDKTLNKRQWRQFNRQKQVQGHKRRKMEEVEEQQEVEPINQKDIMIQYFLCPICKDFIAPALEAVCGHCFCEVCIMEYFLAYEECPICEKSIRGKKYTKNKKIDEMISQFMGTLEPEINIKYQRKFNEAKKYKESQKIDEVEVGNFIDIRDENYFWTKAIVSRRFTRIYEQQRRTKFIVVKYLDRDKKQELEPTSVRLAKAGFYTDRPDLPKLANKTIVIAGLDEQEMGEQSLIRPLNSEEAKSS